MKQSQAFERSLVARVLSGEHRPTLHCVLTVYRPWQVEELRRARDQLLFRLHRVLFRGDRYAGMPTHELIHGFATIETTTRPHVHMLISIAPSGKERLRRTVARLWTSIAPSGDAWFKESGGQPSDVQALARYLTKDLDRPQVRDTFSCLCEVLPAVAGPFSRLSPQDRQSRICPMCKGGGHECDDER